ncbi:hypothetical protein EDB85DRAFT_1891563 [Lactarius pseudohatsudake]|nr:hypothetical protein EDB85DRAFT_1891563 [Lactarius pseudohatsudake]
MPRRRAAESLLPAEDGIEEVIVHHRKTKRGIRTTEKAVPILLPSKAKPEQSSHSKKGKKNDQLESDTAEGSQVILNSLGDTQSQQFIDEQMEGLPDDHMEQGRPQPTTVMEQWLQLRSKYLHIFLEMESHPSIPKCFLVISSALTVLERHSFASPAVSRFTCSQAFSISSATVMDCNTLHLVV